MNMVLKIYCLNQYEDKVLNSKIFTQLELTTIKIKLLLHKIFAVLISHTGTTKERIKETPQVCITQKKYKQEEAKFYQFTKSTYYTDFHYCPIKFITKIIICLIKFLRF